MEADVTALLNTVAASVAIAAFVALVIERLLEVFGSPIYSAIEKFLTGEVSENQPYMVYVGLVLGLLLAYAFSIDAITPTLESLGQTFPANAGWAGWVVTGLVMGGGSNLIHDLWPGSSAKS